MERERTIIQISQKPSTSVSLRPEEHTPEQIAGTVADMYKKVLDSGQIQREFSLAAWAAHKVEPLTHVPLTSVPPSNSRQSYCSSIETSIPPSKDPLLSPLLAALTDPENPITTIPCSANYGSQLEEDNSNTDPCPPPEHTR